MPTQITINQLLIVGAIAGFVVGLVPLILGISNGKRKFGILGFLLSLVAGTIFSLLGAIPVAGIFTWLILRKRGAVESDGDVPPPVDIEEQGDETN